MKKRPEHDDQLGHGPAIAAASAQTVEDLALVEAQLREAEALRASAVAGLARVRARGDGGAAVGMPVAQWLRWTTNQHHAVISGIGNLVDVLDHLPTVRAALAAGHVCLDQAIAVARRAAKVDPGLRRSLDLALAEAPLWIRWDPQMIDWQVATILDELLPLPAEQRERTAARRQFLHVQPELDGQALRYWGRYEGVDAALFDATLTSASDTPKAGTPRGPQRAAGLARILRDWATGHHHPRGDHDAPATPHVTIHLLVEDDHASRGIAAEVLSQTRGFAPRLTAAALAELTGDGTSTKTITSVTRDGVPVAVKGRAGHAIDDPDRLSWDTTRELVALRDRTCRMAGCRNPIGDVHHLVHREDGGSDHHTNLAGLCRACHHRIIHRHRWHGHIDPDGTLWLRRGNTIISTLARHQRRLRPPRTGPPRPDDEPLPF